MTDFAVFILTHGRPHNVHTYKTLIDQGYTGRIFFIIDNEDKKSEEYYRVYGEKVIMFDKKEVALTTDQFDNFEDRRAIVYARNACFEIAKDLGITYFLQLDDDYIAFDYRLFIESAIVKKIRNLDTAFALTIDFYKKINAVSIAYSQGGDFIGGIDNGKELFRFSKRKAMNTFFCSVDRPFKFIGRINEDVNTYTSFQSKGNLFLTFQNISITQKNTQSNKGGMTDMYLKSGTYIKSFYTVICSPSSCNIKMLNAKNTRLHHNINWNNAVPKIIDKKHQK